MLKKLCYFSPLGAALSLEVFVVCLLQSLLWSSLAAAEAYEVKVLPIQVSQSNGSGAKTAPSQANQKVRLLVELGSKKIYSRDGYEFSLGAPGLPRPRQGWGDGIADVSGDGVPSLVFEEHTSPRDCCYRLIVVRLSDPPVEYPPLNLGVQREVRFGDIDGKPGLEVSLSDLTFGGWGSRDLLQPATPVVAQPRSGLWRLYLEQARRENSDRRELVALLKEKLLKENPAHAAQDLPQMLTAALLSLIYSGRPEEAAELLRDVWPPERPGMNDYLKAVAAQLQKSPFAADLKPLGVRLLKGQR